MDDLGVALFLETPQKAFFLSVVYKWYSPCQLGDYIYHRSHLLKGNQSAPRHWSEKNIIFFTPPIGSSRSADVSIHQKLSGTESQRTPKEVARAIGYAGFFGVRSGTVLLDISWKPGITALCRTQRSIGLDLCPHSTTKVWTPRWAFFEKNSGPLLVGWGIILGIIRDPLSIVYRDYFINLETRISINQPGFNGKYSVFFS